jgi:nucleoside-diphosphate-sugar epimerase
MSLHVIVGAGPVGSATASLLADRGERVRVVTRRGGGPQHPAIERVAADATDSDRLAVLAAGAAALYNCANPPYHRWLTDWPPLAAALLAAAERGGVPLVTQSNLYGYGPVPGAMTEETPLAATHPKLKLRADMYREALARHRAGRIRMVETRASDYLQANSIFTFTLAAPLLTGKRAYSPAPLDVPHSWTSINDVARLLVTVAGDERAFGRAWHVPSNPPLTVRQLATRFTEVNGLPRAKVTPMPYPVLWTGGLFSPLVRELRTTRYQFSRPFLMDSSAATKTFGLTPQRMEDALRETAARLRADQQQTAV